jgi:hypothetical protein
MEQLPPEVIKQLLPAPVVEKAYDDLASQPAKEGSKVAVDLVKTARLLLAPFQLAAAFQDRFERRVVERIRTGVPEDRRIQAPAEIVGPAIQNMQYLDDDNPLWQMYEELLMASVDSEAVSKVHPSFVYLISQLSRDEAMILYRLRAGEFEVIDTLDLNQEENRFENRVVEESSIPSTDLWQPDQVELYYSHLSSMSLVEWPVHTQDPVYDAEGVQTGIRRHSTMRLTEFGGLFVSACIPDGGFRTV